MDWLWQCGNYPKARKQLVVDKYHEMFEWTTKNCSTGLSEHLIKKYQSVIDFVYQTILLVFQQMFSFLVPFL